MSSFKKKTPNASASSTSSLHYGLPKGTKISLNYGQILVSSGIESLDNILGGGLPLGSLILVEEDKFTHYASSIANYFIEQGLASGQHLIALSPEESLETILQQLSSWSHDPPAITSQQEEESATAASTPMKIAWRYEHLRTAMNHDLPRTSAVDQVYLHGSDLSRRAQAKDYDHHQIHPLNLSEMASYDDVLRELTQIIEKKYLASASGDRQVLRICLKSWMSPLWEDDNKQHLFRFLHSLRGLLRYSLALCMMTVPMHLYETPRSAVEQVADIILRIESFSGSATLQDLSEYHGILHIRKLPRLNTLVHIPMETTQYGFKTKRKKFIIEKIHLPPEVEEASKDSSSSHFDGTMGESRTCGMSGNKSLDF
jgi:elongator complex protein 4